jgi:menaquinone-dependent protoporphyrinogen oxidase
VKVLVVYASKYGSTRGIAEFIAEKLRQQETQVEARSVDAVQNLGDYDAFVIGSAVYYGSWLKDAAEYVRQNRAVLINRPVWLFSSGPLGSDASANDPKLEPKEIAEFRETIRLRDHRIFFGTFNQSKLGFKDRMVAKMPAARALFHKGDFRNWNDIEAWASGIAQALKAP